MVYHYLCSYAPQKSDMAILAINTLQSDCKDEDPMTRGLALRSLTSLRLPNLAEYVLMPIRKGLNDASPYVRATAVLGCAKLYRHSPEAIKGSDIVDLLYNMLKDKDPVVITDVLNALNEILSSEGGMVFNSQIIMYLLNRLRDFHEWGQCTVLDLVAKYTPTSEKEMFDIMNLLEDRLRHSNSAVVMGTTKVFLNFTRKTPSVHKDVYRRLKAPMLTLMGGGGVELAFCVLSHIQVLVDREPGVFDEEYKHFFVKFNDPLCLKKLKLDVVASLANEKNFEDILNELAEYCTDVSLDIAKTSIRNIGKISLRVPDSVDEAIEHLLGFLDLNIDYVTGESVIALRDLLRKHPERSESVVPKLSKWLKGVDYEAEGKCAVIWMIGEYGEIIDDAPYLLEANIDAFDDEPSHAVRQTVLTAAMKLFFKRAPEMHKMLGRLLKKAVEDTSKVDVRDRALLFYRLLRTDVEEARRVVICPKINVQHGFRDAEAQELKEKIFLEFNSLCPIYEKPSANFVKYVPPEDEKEPAQEHQEPRDEDDEPPREKEADTLPENIQDNGLDLLEQQMSAITMQQPTQPTQVQAPRMVLDAQPTVDAATFQQNWGVFGLAQEISQKLTNPVQNVIEQTLAQKSIHCIAAGTQGSQMKFYFFATGGGHMYLLEAVVDLGSAIMTVKIKTNAPPDQVSNFGQFLRTTLASM